MKGTKRLAVLAMFTAIALTIFVAEAQIPPVVPIPGVKLGLANIVTLIAMALLGRRQAGEILDRKSARLNSSHWLQSRMPSSA